MDNPAALSASSSQLQAIVDRMSCALDAVDEAVVWTDAQGHIQWCNAAFERLTTQPLAALSTQPLLQVLPLAVEGATLPRSLHPVQLGLTAQQPQAGQYEFHQHDRTSTLAITVKPLPCTGDDRTLNGVMLVIRDVTLHQHAPRLETSDLKPKGTEAFRTTELNGVSTWMTDILGSLTEVFYVLDENWCFMYINHHTEQLLQRSQAELLGKHIFTCFPEVSDASVHAKYPWAVKTQSITALESFYAPLNTWFEVRFYPIGNALAVYAQNINKRKQAELERQETEKALRESEQWFRSVFDSTAVGMGVAAPDGSLLQVNAAYCQMLGYTQTEIITKTCQQLVHPDDFASGAEPLKQLLAGELSEYHTERRYFHKKGHIVWGLVSISIVRDGQQLPRYVIYQVQDISDRQAALHKRKQAEAALRESETRLKLALEAARMSTWDWNPVTDEAIYSGGDLNPWFRLPSSVQPNAYATFVAAVHPDDRAYVQDALARALEGADYNVEFRVMWSNSKQHWVSSQGKTYFNELGAPIRMLGVLRDITAHKQSEVALQQLNQELEQRVQRRTAQLEQVNQQLQTAIAAHQQTEAALRQSEERFRIIFDYAPIAMSLSDVHTYHIVKFNRAHYELLGYSKTDLETLTHVDLTHPDDASKNLDLIQQLLDGKITRFQIEKRFVRKSGEWIWTNLTVALIRDPDGRAYTMGMLEDITDRKHAEETLLDNQRFLQLVIDSVPNRIFWKDKNLRYLGCNRQFAIDAGLATPKDIIDKTDVDLPWAVHAERCQMEDLQVLASQQPMLDVEEILVRVGGEHRWIKTTKVPLYDKSGSVVGVLGTYEDITERRQTDQALRLTQFSIDRAVDPIWWVKADGSLYYVNDAACRDLGYPREVILGKLVSDFNPDRVGDWADHWQTVKAKGSLTFEARVQAQDGSFFPVEVTANYVELDGKEYHCSFVRNITKRKQDEAQLRASLAEKETLLKEVHHRVKNNLQMVSSLLNLQLDTIQDPKVQAPLQDSQRRIKAMVLVHERLYQSEHLEKVNFSDYVHHLVTDLLHSYSTDRDKIRLTLALAPLELPLSTAIPCGLIINELVTNALKYAFPGDRMGEIHVSFSVSTNHQCLLTITDDGVGFLESMTSLHHTPSPSSLGLQLVHAFVHQLRGTIELDRSHGCCFKLSFPHPI